MKDFADIFAENVYNSASCWFFLSLQKNLTCFIKIIRLKQKIFSRLYLSMNMVGWRVEGILIRKLKLDKRNSASLGHHVNSLFLQTLSQTCPDHPTAVPGSSAPDEHS